jgi:DNA (cytosine-5)-methyltransferase 1
MCAIARPRGLHVNLFAGGGGASEGERLATGRSPDVAINHWPVAIAMHAANHPGSAHYIEDVFDVDPRVVTGGRPVDFLWMSPTCSHLSRAKGKSLRDERLRAQAWIIRPWIEACRPAVIVLENVVEFLTWGPLILTHGAGCPGDDEGRGCIRGCRFGCPDPARAGEYYREWRDWVVAQGYSLEARKLVAWEYGAPTTRERLYIVMRADGRPARWPKPTHAPEPTPERPNRWRTAADIIDWEIPCRSIFDRKKPLVDATLARLVRGVGKFVLAPKARPFVLKVKSYGGGGNQPMSVDEPVRTVTASKRGEFAVGTAFLAKHYGERRPDEVMGQDLGRPLGVVTTKDHHALVAASMVKFYGTSTGATVDRPVDAVTAQGRKHGLSLALLMRYNGCSIGQSIDHPLGTVETRDRYALVEAGLASHGATPVDLARAHRVYDLMVEHGYRGPGLDHEHRIVLVAVDGEVYVIVDLAMRMLTPRELYRAQGFGEDYIIDPIGPRRKKLTAAEQTKACGNSVCPPVARAIIRALLGLDEEDPASDADAYSDDVPLAA